MYLFPNRILKHYSYSRFVFLLLTALLAGLISIPYGQDEPEPIDAYLNGVFPSTAPEASAGIPLTLSATGAFVNLETMEPAAGLLPYDLNQPFWSDGANKYRWIAVPNDGTHDTPAEQVKFSDEEVWIFPPGTVAIKHFEWPLDYSDASKTTKLETRFIIMAEDGTPYGLTYQWNDDETDAVLPENGHSESIAVRTADGIEIRTWEYPDRDMCSTCHTPVAGHIIGPRTRQLNGEFYYTQTQRSANQLATWNHLGMFDDALDENSIPAFLTSATRTGTDTTLQHRALSYLDSNCGYCHRPGSLRNALFDARLTSPLENSGMLNGFAFNNLSILGSAIIVPGDTSKSLIYQRMKSLQDQVAMPPLAKGQVDTLGLRLIGDWILSLGQQTSIDEASTLPAIISLNGSYPNPFRHKTTISFSQTTDALVTLTLVSAQGIEVSTLLNQRMPPGLHEIELDAKGLASGIYYVRLQSGYTSQTRPLTLLK